MTRARTIAVAVLVAVVAAGGWILADRGGSDHVLRAEFSSAVNLVTGSEVRAGGVRIGTVSAIDLVGDRARLDLGIDDARLWPLRAGTTAQIRIGGNVSYANRYVELLPGPGSGAPLADRAVLPAEDTDVPVEIDALLGTFDAPTRAGLEGTVDGAARNLASRGPEIRRGLDGGGEAFAEIATTLNLASADRAALETLLGTSAKTAATLAGQQDRLAELMTVAAGTMTALATGDDALRATIAALPATLRDVRSTLDRLRPSLTKVDALVGDLRPGAARLRRSTGSIAAAVSALDRTAPRLRRTLTALRTEAPAVTTFLDAARTEGERLAPTLARIAPMTNCLRPYVPEAVAFFSSWGALTTYYDRGGRFAHLNGQVLPIVNGAPFSSQQVVDMFPQLRYSLVRPPGLNVGQARPVAACGTPAGSQNPANDPERR